MARSTFGGTVSDYVFGLFPLAGKQLLRLATATLYLWNAETAGSQVTDLLLDGASVTTIAVADDGQIPAFDGPDDVTSLWVSTSLTGARFRMVADPLSETAQYRTDALAAATDAESWADIAEGFKDDAEAARDAVPTTSELSATFAGRVEPASYTYNGDGTVATETVGGFTTTYAYNADGTVHTATRNGVTLTYSYNPDGTVSGAA